jgi:GH24 family phage-related lysozyme (muramidase)
MCIAFGLIAMLEGFSATAYPDAGGWSIGYGTHGSWVKEGMTISEPKARQLACSRIQEIDELISRTVPFRISITKRVALTSLIYNIGEGGWLKSRTLRELRKGNLDGALKGFYSWTKTEGKVSEVLVRRRGIERRFALGYWRQL